MGNTWEVGRDLEGSEPVEYCDSLFLEACDIGRDRVLLRDCGDVINGGSGGWFEFGGEEDAAGAVGDDEVVDITAVEVMPPRQSRGMASVRSGALGRGAANEERDAAHAVGTRRERRQGDDEATVAPSQRCWPAAAELRGPTVNRPATAVAEQAWTRATGGGGRRGSAKERREAEAEVEAATETETETEAETTASSAGNPLASDRAIMLGGVSNKARVSRLSERKRSWVGFGGGGARGEVEVEVTARTWSWRRPPRTSPVQSSAFPAGYRLPLALERPVEGAAAHHTTKRVSVCKCSPSRALGSPGVAVVRSSAFCNWSSMRRDYCCLLLTCKAGKGWRAAGGGPGNNVLVQVPLAGALGPIHSPLPHQSPSPPRMRNRQTTALWHRRRDLESARGDTMSSLTGASVPALRRPWAGEVEDVVYGENRQQTATFTKRRCTHHANGDRPGTPPAVLEPQSWGRRPASSRNCKVPAIILYLRCRPSTCPRTAMTPISAWIAIV
ncbi:hypothetical protein G7046_g2309 [Stylonectria norvegica]|nr:hypothetical protein G7046_g2309 [Stylonectria norvegica]